MKSEDFLQKMLEVFNFLEEDITSTDEDVDRITQNRANLLCISDKEGALSQENIALALLEEAWNDIIEVSEQDIGKFTQLFQESEEVPIYLISNTNELNVHKILCALRTEDLITEKPEIDKNGFIQIAPNVFLCLSYQIHAFKTDPENASLLVPTISEDVSFPLLTTTPSLIGYLLEHRFGNDVTDIEVISQYPKDLEEAERLGFDKKNLISAQDYFLSPKQGMQGTR